MAFRYRDSVNGNGRSDAGIGMRLGIYITLLGRSAAMCKREMYARSPTHGPVI